MGIRETLNKNPALTTGVTAGIVVLTLAIIIYELVGGSPGAPKISTKAYYTDDDGASYFADDINLMAPFDHNGKPAFKAYVYKCAGTRPFVAYLEKYTEAAKKAIEAARSKGIGTNADPIALEQAMNQGTLVKAPLTGDKGWVKQGAPGSEKVTEIHPPSGGNLDTLEPVVP